MQPNFLPWQISIADFYEKKSLAEKIAFLVNFAVLAPSSHNSQPWRFKLEENHLYMMPEKERALPVSDAKNRQLWISLGCALENILTAADYYGLRASISFTHVEKSEGVKISFFEESSSIKKQASSHKIFAITQRRTNRNKYRAEVPDPAFLRGLMQRSGDEISIHCLIEPREKNAAAEITSNALFTAMESDAFRDELSGYIKSNITSSKLGMPGYSFGVPTPISLLVDRFIKYYNMNRLTRRQDDALLKQYTPVLCVIGTKEDTTEMWLRAGQMYERIALDATMADLATALMAAPIEIENYYQKLQALIGTSHRPQILFRLGYCDKHTKESPRLGASEVTDSLITIYDSL